MTDLLQDLESYLIAKEIADPVYRDYSPDFPDDVVVLFEYEGLAGIPQVDTSRRSVQILARSKSATDAKLKARALHKALVTEDGILNMTANRKCMVNIMQPPFRVKTDDAQRVYYGFNIGILTHND